MVESGLCQVAIQLGLLLKEQGSRVFDHRPMSIHDHFFLLRQLLCVLLNALLGIYLIADSASAQRLFYGEQQGRLTFSVELENSATDGFLVERNPFGSGGRILFAPNLDSLVLNPVADTYIDRYAPGVNFGWSSYLLVGGKGGRSRGRFKSPLEGFDQAAFLKFIVPQIDGNVVKAKLEVYSLTSGYGGGIYYFNPNEDDLAWSESQVTWYSRPTGNSVQGEPGTFVDYLGNVQANRWYTFDVTRAFAHQLSSYSFAIVMREDRQTKWASKESSYPPKLVLYYSARPDSAVLSGKIQYFDGDIPVKDVGITARRDSVELKKTYSDSTGHFAMSLKVQTDSVAVVPEKKSGTDIPPLTIIAYDAALTAKAALGLIGLSPLQARAADADLNGSLLIYDAALIARFAIGLPVPADSHVGDWIFDPEQYKLIPQQPVVDSLNFTAILVGNVHGGWHPLKPRSEWGDLIASAVVGRDSVSLLFETHSRKSFSSFQLAVNYGQNNLGGAKVSFPFHDENIQLLTKDDGQTLTIAGYTFKEMVIDRIFMRIIFRKPTTLPEDAKIIIPYLLLDNIKYPAKRVVLGTKSQKISGIRVFPAYPNPFNRGVEIKFETDKPAEISIHIYDLRGRIVREIRKFCDSAGVYRIVWNGKDRFGKEVSSGIYIVESQILDKHSVQKLLLIK